MVIREITNNNRVNKPAIIGLKERNMGKFTSKDGWYKDVYTNDNEDQDEAAAWEPELHPQRKPITTAVTRYKPKCTVQVEAIIFVPATKNSGLCKALQSRDDEFTKVNKINRFRFVECIGTTIIDLLGCKDPWGQQACEIVECWPCKDEGSRGSCRYEGVTYSIICQECLKSGIKAEYSGETSRSLYQRGK